ncbi:Inhibitor of growth protein 4 [Leucoagaricus sp. SymC.cos]|nr:Inhibitor of growth protein 4 [Leucoagaricus sp. SymC.cos]
MSARTRSSTRIQALQAPDDPEESVGFEEEEEREDGTSASLEEKEQEIWDEIRDEHYDIIEQLPLTIHRQLTLLHQLDCQSRDYSDSLLPAIKQYIQLRQKLALKDAQTYQVEAQSSPHALSPQDGNSLATVEARDISVSSSSAAQTKISLPSTTREMLSHIAWLNEEYLRASREKVNIAQTVQDSVDRHIRLLDQFIKEQEASLGPEPNAPVMLSMSELVVPKWSRSTRVSMSPMLDEEEQVAPPAQATQPGPSAPQDRSGKRRPPKNRKNKEKEKEKDDQNSTPSLKITLPPPHPDIYIDPNEPTWCYCNRISFGEMIGCDDPECKYEWFHLECVALKAVPEDEEWYCRECNQRREAKNRRR